MDGHTEPVQVRNSLILAPDQGRKQSAKMFSWLDQPREKPMEIAEAKAKVDFKGLVEKTHVLKAKKVLCPAHDDRNPSCHVYDDHWYCFTCGAGGDVIDWLEAAHKLTTTDAIARLRELAGGTTWTAPSAPRVRSETKPDKKATLRPIDGEILEAHLARAEQLQRGPLALSGRGFTLSDLRQLGIAADGDDAVIPITGPNGDVMALKRRLAVPRSKQRYVYDTPGHGTPAWCSLGFLEAREALVIEGELNGMASWLARPQLGVQGVAGTSGDPYAEALKGKIVYVYADSDKVGLEARTRWAKAAQKAGAAEVYVVQPWEMDACDVAGQLGRVHLAGRLA